MGNRKELMILATKKLINKKGVKISLGDIGLTNKKLFLIIALDWTTKNSPVIWFWGVEGKSYTPKISKAGIFTKSEIKKDPDRFINKVSKPISINKVKGLAGKIKFNDKQITALVNDHSTRERLQIRKKELGNDKSNIQGTSV